jgi:DNA primase
MAPAPSPDVDTAQQVKSRLDLVQLISERVRLQRRGRQFVGLCPFHHEDTASFYVTPEKQFWKCFGCDRSGDAFTFVELTENTDFKGALELLAERTGVELRAEDAAERRRRELRRRILELNALAAQYYEYVLWHLPAGGPGRELLARRQVGEETARRFQLGFAPGGKGFSAYVRKRSRAVGDAVQAGLVRRDERDFFQQRLIIPVRDERARPVAFVGRTAGDDPRKYINSPETPAYVKGRVVFALDLAREALSEAGHAVVMEGQFDVIVAHQYGVRNAVATSGTALTEDQVRLLKRFTDELVLVFDSDAAGRHAAYRAVELAAGVGIRTRMGALRDAKDPDEFLRAAGSEASSRWQELVNAALPGWEAWIRDSIQDLNPARPADLEVAISRVRGVLARIPEPAVRERYRERAASWLGAESAHLSLPADGWRRAAAREPAAASAEGPPRGARSAASSATGFLLRVLAAHPEYAPLMTRLLPPDQMPDEDGVTYRRMLEATAKSGLQANLSGFGEGEKEMIRSAWANPPPAVDEAVVVDAVRRVKRETLEGQMRLVISEIAVAEQGSDGRRVEELGARWRELQRARRLLDRPVVTES